MQVVVGDTVTLLMVQAGQALHASEGEFSNHPGCREVNGIPSSATAWRLIMYLEYTELQDPTLLRGVSAIYMQSSTCDFCLFYYDAKMECMVRTVSTIRHRRVHFNFILIRD